MRAFLLFLLLALLPPATRAAIVEQVVSPGVNASAEFLVGERGKPAVLLHGFLQTRDFPTVATLARGVHDAGYTVLVPTLSLRIPSRRQSLACEAIHRHGLDDDVAEIGVWVGWLKAQGYSDIVLLGHSFGSMQLLAYLSARPDPAVRAFIGTSLVEAQIGKTPRQALIADLEQRVGRGQRALVTQPLSFCRKYVSSPDGLLSYARWDQARTLKALRQSPVEVKLIMGDADNILGRGWLTALEHIRVPMVVVRGANHFMDGEHEFDLLEHTLAFMQKRKAGSQ